MRGVFILYWDIQRWRNFFRTIDKAKESCVNAGELETDLFVDANKMISLAKGATRSVEDILLTRQMYYLL